MAAKIAQVSFEERNRKREVTLSLWIKRQRGPINEDLNGISNTVFPSGQNGTLLTL